MLRSLNARWVGCPQIRQACPVVVTDLIAIILRLCSTNLGILPPLQFSIRLPSFSVTERLGLPLHSVPFGVTVTPSVAGIPPQTTLTTPTSTNASHSVAAEHDRDCGG